MPDDIVERCQEWEESGCGFYHTSLGIVVLWGTYIPDDRRNDLSSILQLATIDICWSLLLSL